MSSSMQSILHGVREYLTPILQESQFLEKGVLTPEEFVKAGDQLVYKCPTWKWEAGDPGKARPYLPVDKQFLVTVNVPCRQRVDNMGKTCQKETLIDSVGEMNDDGWIATHTLDGETSCIEEKNAELDDISARTQSLNMIDCGSQGKGILGGPVLTEHFGSMESTDDDDEFPDIATFDEDNLVQSDEATLTPVYMKAEEPDDNIVLSRTYDISISYDKFYQTPRVWLFGYNETGQPLSPEELFEDIMQDYANRTVTIEPHPHKELPHASIHPCRHAEVMKRIVDNLCGGGKEARSDQYLFIFLKFVQSVVPTIDYDFTMEVEMNSKQ